MKPNVILLVRMRNRGTHIQGLSSVRDTMIIFVIINNTISLSIRLMEKSISSRFYGLKLFGLAIVEISLASQVKLHLRCSF